MEFAGRQTLQQLLDDSMQEISAERRINLLNQIAYGIQYCHDSKIIHLDIKPANVMVMSGDFCKLVDFGSSKRLDIEHECNQEFTIGKRAPLGTVIYCAPEIFTNKLVTPKADIYSFGITMWQMITRIIPFAEFESHSIIYRVINANYVQYYSSFLFLIFFVVVVSVLKFLFFFSLLGCQRKTTSFYAYN
jgi:proto-oncogene serine/threonine-protein kinase mos